MAGKAEIEFRRRYPHARVEQTSPKPYEMFTVYAGDYVCAEGHTKAIAFERALQLVEDGLITPDPEEKSTKGEEKPDDTPTMQEVDEAQDWLTNLPDNRLYRAGFLSYPPHGQYEIAKLCAGWAKAQSAGR